MTNAQVVNDISGNDTFSISGLTTGKEPKTKWLPADVRFLVLHFLDKRKDIHTDALDILSRNNFGNSTREIMNLVEDLVGSVNSRQITPEDLPFNILTADILNGILENDILSYDEAKKRLIDEFDRIVSAKYVATYGGNAGLAAGAPKPDRPISRGSRVSTVSLQRT